MRDQRDVEQAHRSNTSRHAMIRSPSEPRVFDSTVKLSQAALAALDAFTSHGVQVLRKRISLSLSVTDEQLQLADQMPFFSTVPNDFHEVRTDVEDESPARTLSRGLD